MPYIIGIVIILVMIMTISFTVLYYRINTRNDEARKTWRSILRLLNQREILIKNLADYKSIYIEGKDDLLFQLQETLSKCKASNAFQEIVDYSLITSEKLEHLLAFIPEQKNEVLKSLVKQLDEIESNLRLSFYEYNVKVYIFNEWICKFPQNKIALILGMESLKHILLEEE